MRTKTVQLVLTVALLLVNHQAWAESKQNVCGQIPGRGSLELSWFEEPYNIVKAEDTTPPPALRICVNGPSLAWRSE
jgi:hypothetical protein